VGRVATADRRGLLDVEADAEQQERPKNDGQHRRQQRPESAGVLEIVV
jgi:hypothetical protein